MKRKSEVTSAARLGDILQATTVEQRAWIGAVVLAYNDAEAALHRVAGACFDYNGPNYSITSRINGTEGVIAIIAESVDAMGLPASSRRLVAVTLGEQGFSFLKTMRDSVVHAELFDSGLGLGTAPGKRGKTRQEVLLTPLALEGLYKRLALVTRELSDLEMMIGCERASRVFEKFGADDQRKAHNEQDIQGAIARCQSRQRQRQSLPPFPKFPEPPDIHELLPAWLNSPHKTKTLRVQIRDD